MDIVVRNEMDTVSQIQILDSAVCIRHRSNPILKGKNPAFLSAISKIKSQFGLLVFVWKHVCEKENSKLKPVKLDLKIEFVFRSTFTGVG